MTVTANEEKQGLRRLMECSLQDLIAILIPYMIALAAVVVAACILYDPTMMMLLYSAVPQSYKNWFSCGICFVEETRLLLIFVGINVPTFQLQMIAFELLNCTLEEILHSVQTK